MKDKKKQIKKAEAVIKLHIKLLDKTLLEVSRKTAKEKKEFAQFVGARTALDLALFILKKPDMKMFKELAKQFKNEERELCDCLDCREERGEKV